MRRAVAVAILLLALVTVSTISSQEPADATSPAGFIDHVVIIYQENHSFDEVLGALCIEDQRCDGSLTATLLNGSKYPLKQSPDIVPEVNHDSKSQNKAINGGLMNGWEKVPGCTPAAGYPCLTYYEPTQIPNLAQLARSYVISDRTFQLDTVPSFGAHIDLVAGTVDGFTGSSPHVTAPFPGGSGWGCDSNKFAAWRDPDNPKAAIINVPACIPNYTDPLPYLPSDRSAANGGAITSTPVKHVPTLMNRLDEAGLSWRFYAAPSSKPASYLWSICPVFADCIYTSDAQNMVSPGQIINDAAAGTLPAYSVLLPEGPAGKTSQHNARSMLQGDNWIGQVVQSIMSGPNWPSTAIFITYDDCGCFFDHVAPPANFGIRNPVVIVSPYARPGYTDSTVASTASLLAFTEHTFGLAPLAASDAAAYDYSDAFSFVAPPVLTTPQMVRSTIPLKSRQYLASHPVVDSDDPT